MRLSLSIEVRELFWLFLDHNLRASGSITVDYFRTLQKVAVSRATTGYYDFTFIDLVRIVVPWLAELAYNELLLLAYVYSSITLVACEPNRGPLFDVLYTLSIAKCDISWLQLGFLFF